MMFTKLLSYSSEDKLVMWTTKLFMKHNHIHSCFVFDGRQQQHFTQHFIMYVRQVTNTANNIPQMMKISSMKYWNKHMSKPLCFRCWPPYLRIWFTQNTRLSWGLNNSRDISEALFIVSEYFLFSISSVMEATILSLVKENKSRESFN